MIVTVSLFLQNFLEEHIGIILKKSNVFNTYVYMHTYDINELIFINKYNKTLLINNLETKVSNLFTLPLDIDVAW
jgi:hypothetical protein